jgi:hypothetical protein
MKVRLSLVLFIITASMTVNSFAQEFTLITTTANTVASKSTIEMAGLANNPNAIIVATPLGDAATSNPHPIGAWYYNGKWNIFNTDHATMPAGLKFKLQVFLKPDATHFLHIVTKQNLSDEGSEIDNPLINNNPKAQINILQNYAPDNRSPYNLNKFEAKAFFNSTSGRWYIANVNGKTLFQSINTAYNIVISSGQNGDSTQPQSSPTTSAPPIPTPKIPTISQTSTTSGTSSCTKEAAWQTIGKWGKQKKDDLAMADRTYPKDQFKPVLAKAQKVVDLFMKANPEFKGIQATAQRSIFGDSYLPNGALPFSLDIGYSSFHCIGKNEGTAEERGKIIVFGGYGHTTVRFNSLHHVLESVMKTDGDEIFGYKKQLGEFKGFTFIEPKERDEDKREAIIIVPGKNLPYKPVTREQYLLARIKDYGTADMFAADVAKLKTMITNMSPTEKQFPAIVSDITASPGRAKLFVTEAEDGIHLVTIDKSFFNPKLPRDVIQLITVDWSWKDKDVPKAEAIRQFKENFDFEALKQMLGK